MTVEEITDSVTNGDQAWRSDIQERWSVYLDGVAAELDAEVAKLQAMKEPPAGEVETFQAYAAEQRILTAGVRDGSITFDPIWAEVTIRLQG